MSAAIVTYPPPEDLDKLLDYRPDTGEVFWKPSSEKNASWNTRFANKQAGAIIKNKKATLFYRYITFSGKPYPAHRIIWMLYYGVMPSGVIDHINGNGIDNRIENLRCVTHSVNSKNAILRSHNRSGVSGVSWHQESRRWVVRVHVNSVRKHIGEFKDFFEAVCARKSAELIYDYHANHGRKYEKPDIPEKPKRIFEKKAISIPIPFAAGGVPGAALAALRKPKPGVCQVCGAAFVTLDSRARYCSNRCKQKAAGARRKAIITDNHNQKGEPC